MTRSWPDCFRKLAVLLLSVHFLSACNSSAEAPKPTPSAVATASSQPRELVPVERDAKGAPISYSVVAYGYNYTDLYIDSFEVDGAGGGNLAVSTPSSPGGGSTCCALVTSGLPLGTTFNIKWTRDRERWCQQDVPLTKPVPWDAKYLEVHFYPDGKIEIEATQQASPPRLALERASRGERHETGNVNNDEKYSRCKNGYR
jgi:Protein of unknown function (DUF3304)